MTLLADETMDALDELQKQYEDEPRIFTKIIVGCQSCSNSCSGCEGSCGGACQNGPNLQWD